MLKVCMEKYQDENSTQQPQEIIETLLSTIKCEEKVGSKLAEIELFDTLQAKSTMKNGKAADANGLVAEVLKALPYNASVYIHDRFSEYYKG